MKTCGHQIDGDQFRETFDVAIQHRSSAIRFDAKIANLRIEESHDPFKIMLLASFPHVRKLIGQFFRCNNSGKGRGVKCAQTWRPGQTAKGNAALAERWLDPLRLFRCAGSVLKSNRSYRCCIRLRGSAGRDTESLQVGLDRKRCLANVPALYCQLLLFRCALLIKIEEKVFPECFVRRSRRRQGEIATKPTEEPHPKNHLWVRNL